MKQKSHSGLKKRLKIRKSGRAMFQKSAKKHLLSNKSKRQKGASPDGLPIFKGMLQDMRRLIPGKIKAQYESNTKKRKVVSAEKIVK
ncbi:MAG: bL35 family ribosomal protein [Patescibacteria group bacterium]